MPPRANRRQRRERRPVAASPLAHIPWQTVTNSMPPLSRLNSEAEEKIHEASMRILEDIGLLFMDAEALDMWQQAGAKVDHGRQQVWLDRHLVLELVSKGPPQFIWRARNPAHTVSIGQNHITFAPNGGTVYIQDLEHGRRPGLMKDYTNLQKMVRAACTALLST